MAARARCPEQSVSQERIRDPVDEVLGSQDIG